jgi:hypothetical protein
MQHWQCDKNYLDGALRAVEVCLRRGRVDLAKAWLTEVRNAIVYLRNV